MIARHRDACSCVSDLRCRNLQTIPDVRPDARIVRLGLDHALKIASVSSHKRPYAPSEIILLVISLHL
jgi:hypothetical protein